MSDLEPTNADLAPDDATHVEDLGEEDPAIVEALADEDPDLPPAG